MDRNYLLRNLVLASTATVKFLQENPLHFIIQLKRRLPSKLSKKLEQIPTPWMPATLSAVWEFIVDRPQKAQQLLNVAGSTKLHDLIRVELGLTPKVLTGETYARYLWKRGHCRDAIKVAGNSLLGKRFSDEWNIISTDRVIKLPPQDYEVDKTQRPRVLHLLTNSLPHTQSGYSIRSHEVLKAQSKYMDVLAVTRLGYPVVVGKLNAKPADVIDGITYKRLIPYTRATFKSERLVAEAKALAEEVQWFKPHIIQTTTNYENALVANAVARAFGIPWIYEMRGELEKTWLSKQPTELQDSAKRSAYYVALRHKEVQVANLANAVTVLSEYQKHSMKDRGVDTKIEVLPNAVDEKLLKTPFLSPAHARAKLSLPTEGFWVGSVSSIVGYEGFDTLINAVKLCRDKGYDVRCCLVGDGVSRPSLQEQAKKLGIADYVTFPGKVSHTQTPMWYQALNCFIVSRKNTPVCKVITPLKPITALGLRRPVIVSNLPALLEITGNGQWGISFESEDFHNLATTIVNIMTDNVKYNSLVARGHEFASGRTWTRNGEIYFKLVQDIIR